MKICFITYNIFELGGVQRVLSILANELIKYHEVDILCEKISDNDDRSIYNLNNNINVISGEKIIGKSIYQKFWRKPFRYLNDNYGILNKEEKLEVLADIYYPKSNRDKLIKFLKSKSYDVVIGVEGFASIMLAMITDKLQCKTIGWQHNSYEAYFKNKNKYYWQQDKLFEMYIKKLDNYIVLTNHDKQMYLEYNNINCDVISNPRSFTSSEKSEITSNMFLAAGRFNYQKGFDLLIESFKTYVDEGGTWNLNIVGEGSEKPKIENMIEKYNLSERVKLTGITNDIKKYFLNSSVLLLSSRWEGMPMIVLESLEMGVPIISYNITAIEPLVDNNKEGLIIEKFDTKKFAEAMDKISNSYEMRYRLSRNAIEKSNEFEIGNIIKQWNSLLF